MVCQYQGDHANVGIYRSSPCLIKLDLSQTSHLVYPWLTSTYGEAHYSSIYFSTVQKRETNLSNSFTTNGSLTVVSIPFILAPTILDVSIVTYSYYCISKMPMDPQYLPPSLSYGCRRVPTTVGPLLNHLHQWLHYTPYLHFLIYPSPILPSPEPVPGILH